MGNLLCGPASLDLERRPFYIFFRMSLSFRFLFLACPVLVGVPSFGAVALDDLVRSSPFLPGGQENVIAAPSENAAVEFRGMITTRDGTLFGLYDRTTQTGAWVRKQDKAADFLVQSYDSANDVVVVDYHGQKFNLALSSSKIVKAAASMPVPVAAMTDVQPQGAGSPAVARADDQRRLESISAEVRRRRALRQGAAAGAATPPAGRPAGTRQ